VLLSFTLQFPLPMPPPQLELHDGLLVSHLPVPLHVPVDPQLSHFPSPFLSTKFLPWAQAALASWLQHALLLLSPADLPEVRVVAFAVVFAGTVVVATCEKPMPVKNINMVKVIKILDAVFIVCLFLRE
jgi:hypothetical protein